MKKKVVIVRADRAGVFFGTLEEVNGTVVKMSNCRRIWYWDGANSISQIAMEGIKNHKSSKVTMAVNEIQIFGVIEIIPCTKEAIENIDKIPAWKI